MFTGPPSSFCTTRCLQIVIISNICTFTYQDESFEENLSGDEEAIASDEQLDQEMDDAIPWIQHYDDQALAQDVHFIDSTYYDDDDAM